MFYVPLKICNKLYCKLKLPLYQTNTYLFLSLSLFLTIAVCLSAVTRHTFLQICFFFCLQTFYFSPKLWQQICETIIFIWKKKKIKNSIFLWAYVCMYVCMHACVSACMSICYLIFCWSWLVFGWCWCCYRCCCCVLLLLYCDTLMMRVYDAFSLYYTFLLFPTLVLFLYMPLVLSCFSILTYIRYGTRV